MHVSTILPNKRIAYPKFCAENNLLNLPSSLSLSLLASRATITLFPSVSVTTSPRNSQFTMLFCVRCLPLSLLFPSLFRSSSLAPLPSRGLATTVAHIIPHRTIRERHESEVESIATSACARREQGEKICRPEGYTRVFVSKH